MLHFLMKRLSLLFLIAGAANLSSYAQAPGKFNYQAIARDNAGVIIASRPITVRFSILDIDPDGKSLYTETFSLNTNNLGLFTAAIGGGNIISGNFSNIDWSGSSKFLKTEIDFNDGKGMQPAVFGPRDRHKPFPRQPPTLPHGEGGQADQEVGSKVGGMPIC